MQRRFSVSEVPRPEALSAGMGPRSRSSTELSSSPTVASFLMGALPSTGNHAESTIHRANRSRSSSVKSDVPLPLAGPQRLPRIIVASNRLPITVTRVPATTGVPASWTCKMSSGGLVAALAGLDKSQHDFVWVGWVGCEIPEDEQESFAEQLWEEHQCVPVFLDDKLADDHYNGFSNGILWPLFHYISHSSQQFSLELWKSYRVANKKFAEVILAVADAQDLVWVHDYHLMMLPRYLRRKLPHSSIGFFLHIPFPSSEVFKTLPVREDLLHALLDSNLVGFHTYDYARHFMQACAYLIDQIETTPTGIFRHSHYTVVGAYAVGIEPEKFTEQLQREEVRARIDQLRKSFAGKKVILGVDRLDYIKGVPHKMRAMRRLLHQHPEWRDRVVLIQIAVPTRPDVPEYKQLKCEVEELVGSINGQYGSIGSNPIHYLFTSVPMAELTALYAVADVLLVTSIRDGMNLVCQEYIACQDESHGVVVLSEFAGAASCLSAVLRVNPWNIQEVADAIHDALSLPADKRAQMHDICQSYIQTYTSRSWGKRFIDELTKHTKKTDELVSVQQLKYEDVLGPYRTSKSRLLVLNYDGGLLDYTTENFVSTSRPSARIVECLKALSDDTGNTIFIFSGREREVLQNWFGGMQAVGLVAEHGFFLKPPREEQWYQLEAMDLSWMKLIRPVLEYFKERTPGSEIEQKEVHMVWHYRRCRPDYGLLQARELYQTISAIHDVAVEVVHDSELRTVEIRPPVVNATPPVMSSFNQLNPEFVMHIGNRQTAEKIRHHFENRVAENRLFTCIVGRRSATTPQVYERQLGRVSSSDSIGAGIEIAKSTYIDKPTDVLDFLKFLASQAPQGAPQKLTPESTTRTEGSQSVTPTAF